MKRSFLILAFLAVAIPCSADIVYVKEGGTGSGTSWADPNGLLQWAIDNANSNDEVWVAEGTYKPTYDHGLGVGDRGKHFRMKNDVAVYGGFPDTGEPDMADRDPNKYMTILSGDLLGNDNPETPVEDLLNDPCRTDNCYHVFYHPDGTNLDPNAILDGFTVTAGNADGSYPHSDGGGMLNYSSSPTITDCIFVNNLAILGGGICNLNNSNPMLINCSFSDNLTPPWGEGCGGNGMYNDQSSPTLVDCIFFENSGGSYGGGMFNTDSSPTLTNCYFRENTGYRYGGGIANFSNSNPTLINCIFSGCSSRSGGGICNYYDSNPTLTNCTFNDNSAEWGGGGMKNYQSSPTLTNCTFVENTGNAYDGGGMHNNSSSSTLRNCIFWDNTAANGNEIALTNSSTIDVAYCDVEGAPAGIYDDLSGNTINWGSGNIDADPLFADPNGPDGIIGTEDDNLRLLAGSPCIDAGDSNSVPPDLPDLDGDGNTTEPIPFDLDGLPRLYDDPHTIDTGTGTPPIVDMGAHEFIPCDFEPDGDIDEVDFITFILYWLDTGCGRCGGADLTGEGDVNLADFAEFASLWQAIRLRTLGTSSWQAGVE